MEIRVQITGLEDAQAKLQQLSQAAVEAMGKGLYRAGEQIMTASKEECPVDTGTLRSTGHVEQPKVEGKSVTVQLGYGGPAAPYAIWVHERLDLHHTVGKAKFLEDPARAAAPQAGELLGQVIKAALGE